MKENNYIRLKIYFLIFIISYVFGWIVKKTEIVMVVENRDIRNHVFNYAAFGLFIAIGFSITLVFDIYILQKSKRDKK